MVEYKTRNGNVVFFSILTAIPLGSALVEYILLLQKNTKLKTTCFYINTYYHFYYYHIIIITKQHKSNNKQLHKQTNKQVVLTLSQLSFRESCSSSGQRETFYLDTRFICSVLATQRRGHTVKI